MTKPGSGRLMVAAIGVAIVTASCSSATTPNPSASAKPQYGGTLRVTEAGDGTGDTLTPWLATGGTDFLRAEALYEPLSTIGPNGAIVPVLAKSIVPNQTATEWTVNLRPGVLFADGKPLTAQDVIYSYTTVIKNGYTTQLANVDLSKTVIVDDLTIDIALKYADWDFPFETADASTYIVRDGLTDFSHPDGTGPFRFVSYTAGVSSTFIRNPDYWDKGLPYVDTLVITDINDATSRASALLSGQVDVALELPYTSVGEIKNSGSTYASLRFGGTAPAYYMRGDTPPFNNPVVRQAIRLGVNRQQCVEAGLDGYGKVANDLFGPGAPYYDNSLPQRQYDPTMAKQLLQQAGISNLKVTLYTADAYTGMQACAQVIEQSEKAAGITVTIDTIPADQLYNTATIYLKVGFGSTNWLDTNFLEMTGLSFAAGAPFNETAEQMIDPNFAANLQAAEGIKDKAARTAAYDALQKDLYEDGGYIVWGTEQLFTGYSNKVHGAPTTGVAPLLGYPGDGPESLVTPLWMSK